MVRTVVAACFVLLLAIPALAQEDYPRIQTSMGYANLSFPDFLTGETTHHSGFSNQTGFNLTRTWGLENYMGIYSLGQGITLIADTFGGKATLRKSSRFIPYALAGIGVGYFTSSQSGGSLSAFSTRYGAGFDVPINDSLAWKIEVSRFAFHHDFQSFTGGGWTNSTNIAAGVVFTLAQ